MMNDETFSSRDEAIDFGKDYEYLMAAYYGLVFSLNADVADFKLSTNNNDMGDFDDVVIEIKMNNGEEQVFALQLKHVVRPIAQVTLINKNKKFSLKKYSEEFQKVKTKHAKNDSYSAPFENFHFVLFTNSTLEKFEEFDDNWKKMEPVADGKTVQSDVFIQRSEDFCGRKLLDVSQTDETFLYKFKSEKEDSLDEEFFKQFSFYTKQKDAKEMESLIAEIILKKFKNCDPNVVVNYLNYFSYWCRRDFGMFKLTKEDVTVKLAELVLTSYIPEANMYKMEYYSQEKAELFFHIFVSFDIILIDNDSDEVVDRIWAILLKQYAAITKEWSMPISGLNINLLKDNLKIPMSALSENFNEMSMKKLYTVMWHVGCVPLVIQIDNKLTCEENILFAIELSKNSGSRKNFVLISHNEYFKDHSEWKIFRCLSDVSANFNTLYNRLIENILISVQGRPRISLKQFIETDERLIKTVTTTEVMLMMDDTFVVGNDCKKKFPAYYINRLIPKVLLDISAINELEQDLFVLSSTDAVDNNIFAINSVDVDKYLLLKQFGHAQNLLPKQFKISFLQKIEEDQKNLSDKFLVLAQGGCTKLQFEEICSMNPEKNCHLVHFVDNQRIEWIDSRGNIDKIEKYRFDLKTFKSDDFVKDEDVLAHFTNKINVICAEPGMGKSIMMKFLMFKCPSDHWVVMISLGEHVKFFNQKRNIDEILDFFLKMDTKAPFIEKIVNILSSRKQIMFLWDGFDELPRKCKESVIASVEVLARDGYLQWLAARTESKQFLQDTFKVFALTLTQFNQQNQYEYVCYHLKEKYGDDKEVEEIVDNMNENITTSLNSGYFDYTGVPLQIHMLVDCYLRKPDVAKDTLLVTLTDIYQVFIEGKFDSIFEKADADPGNYYMQQIREQFRNSQLVLYENAAINSAFDEELLHNIDLECDELFADFKEGEDSLGLILDINDDKKAIFAHKTYEEFLAASWLAKNWQIHTELVKLLFEEKYNNIRFMFDMLLAKNSPVHLAVLYRNLDMVKQHAEEIENCKDQGGRSALHLACSWGRRHPVIKEMKNKDEAVVVNRSSEENHNYWLELIAHMKQFSTGISELTEILTNSTALDVADRFLNEMHQQVDDSSVSPDTITINGETFIRIQDEDATYLNIVQYLIDHKCKSFENDELFKWNAFQYADVSLSLAALNLIIKYHKISLESLKNYSHMLTLVHYSVNFLYDHILETIPEIPYIEYRYHHGRVNLLQQAADANNLNAINKLLANERYKEVVNEQSAFSSNVLTFAILRGNLEMVDVFLENGAKVNGHKMSPLVSAIFSCKIECCKKLLEVGADVNALAPNGDSPLLMSAMLNQLEIMKLLLEKGADLNYINRDYDPLEYAVGGRNLEMVQVILQYKPNINRQNEKLGYTALHCASEFDNLDILKCLLEHGADATIKSKKSLTALHVALVNKQKENALELIKADPSVVNDEWEDQDEGVKLTPIMLATMKNFPDVIQVLKENGADVETTLCTESNCTPLMYAAIKNLDSCVVALVQAGASVNRPDVEGMVPLFFSVNNLTITKILLEHSADVNTTSNCGKTALHFAAGKGNIEVAEELIQMGINPNAKDKSDKSPLYFSIQGKHTEMTKFLLDQGAVIEDGAELLYTSVKLDHSEFIPLLVNKGADINSSTKPGLTPLFYASFLGSPCVKTLLESGADPNVCCLNDISPLGISIWFSRTNVMKELISAGADMKRVDKSLSALHVAAIVGDIFSMVLLIGSGAVLNAWDDIGRIPLHYSCEDSDPSNRSIMEKMHDKLNNDPFDICINYNREECVKELLAKGSNIHERDIQGNTPLHLACQNKETYIVPLLIEYEADINALNNKKQSPLHVCYSAVKLEDADLLLQNGAVLSMVDDFGKTPLNYAMETIIISGNLQKLDLMVVDKLRKLGANIDLPYKNTGKTLLHIAAEKGDITITQYLLENGANVENKTIDEECTPIFYACQNNHKEVLLMLLEKKCQVNVQNKLGNTPLHFACTNGYVEIIQLLIDVGSDVNILNSKGSSALHVAAKYGSCKCCKMLLDKGANINQLNHEENSPLHLAVMSKDIDVVKLQVDSGADLDQRDDQGRTALFYACSDGDLNLVKFLHAKGGNIFLESNSKVNLLIEASQHILVVKYLVENGLNVNHKSNGNVTPLYKTCICNNYDGALYLLENGADINAVTEKWNLTPIHCAAIEGHVRIVKLLLDFEADLTIRSASGNTPISGAASKNNIEVFKFFVEELADTQCGRNKNGIVNKGDLEKEWKRCFFHSAGLGSVELLTFLHQTGLAKIDDKDEINLLSALHIACYCGKYDAALYLIENGADVNVKSVSDETSIYLASQGGHLDIIKLLVEHNAEIDAPTNHGNTGLFIAATIGYLEIVEFLYEKGAIVDMVDVDGDLPLHDAAYRGHLSIVKYLISKKTNIEHRNKNGKSALDLAIEQGNKEIAQFLKEQ